MLVDGINVVRELLKADIKVEKIFAVESDNNEIVSIVDKARAKGIKVQVLSKQDFDKKINIELKQEDIMARILVVEDDKNACRQ